MSRDTCPSCGHHGTLEEIHDAIQAMKNEGKRRARERQKVISVHVPVGIVAGDGTLSWDASAGHLQVGNPVGQIQFGGDLLSHDHDGVQDIRITNRVTCEHCGTWYRQDAVDEAERLREELLRVTNEVYTPIERMAKLAEDDV